ncbi:hypothetical protein ACFO5R_20980 [Halosolutus amylolyticus]|uniref:LAGLIDADG homing endonuclease n=1 Tax=Halosolutus amylolyticus TaxID=2932267 RepID=A0ABD5PV08_9EURY|nr:hypothetical protein [Halosolutus amylolyticus]
MKVNEPYEEQAIPIPYVAGVFDGMGSIILAIQEKKRTGVGYQVQPWLRITTNSEPLAGLLDEFALQHGLRHQFNETEAGSIRWQIQAVEDCERFLDLVMPYLVKEYERAEIMRNDILPLLKDQDHHTKQGMIRLAGLGGELTATRNRQRERKYTEDYFRELWEDDLTGTS